MSLKPGIIAAASLLLGATLALSGCAAEPTDTGETTPPSEVAPSMDAEAVWLDSGRMIGVVTWGSSSCIPFLEDVTATGQEITVGLSDTIEGQEPRACTADMAPRASAIGVPAGVDPTQDVKLNVNYGEQTLVIELDGEKDLTGVPGDPTDYLPSAAWMHDDTAIVLLTWGSSTCIPMIESVEETDAEIVATFKDQTGPCTMDMAPRTTMLQASGENDDRVLKLVGDNLDATIQVVG